MLILQVTATFSPSINGVAITVEKIREELGKQGHEVVVIAPQNLHKSNNEQDVIRYPSAPNPILADYPLPLFPSLKKIIKLLANRKPDLIHVHTPFHVGYFAKKLASYYQIPLVFTYHTRYGDYAENYLKLLPNQIKRKLVSNSVDNFCTQVDLIVSPSKAIRQELLDRISDLKIVTIPSGLAEIPKVNLSKKATRKVLNLPEDKKVILVVCRLAKEKNIPLLIKSLKKLNKNYMLVIVGGGNYENQLKKLAVQEKIANRVKFIGPVEHNKLGIYFQTADIFTFASTTETQGLIFLEALSFGLPVVAVNSEAAKEWVDPSVGILAKNNSKDFAAQIKVIEKFNKTEISKKAKIIAAQFSSHNMIEKMLTEYKRLKVSL